jgi:predicted transcriptional regulator
MGKIRKSKSDELLKVALHLRSQGKSMASIAKTLGVSPKTISRWLSNPTSLIELKGIENESFEKWLDARIECGIYCKEVFLVAEAYEHLGKALEKKDRRSAMALDTIYKLECYWMTLMNAVVLGKMPKEFHPSDFDKQIEEFLLFGLAEEDDYCIKPIAEGVYDIWKGKMTPTEYYKKRWNEWTRWDRLNFSKELAIQSCEDGWWEGAMQEVERWYEDQHGDTGLEAEDTELILLHRAKTTVRKKIMEEDRETFEAGWKMALAS